jgi:citrate lyase beta subunit
LRILSQNLINYGFDIPENTILRINLAWCDSINQLSSILEKNTNYLIFLDLPIKRIKPPNNKYTLDDIIPVIDSNPQIKYFAISNVESASDLTEYLQKIPSKVILVPKIESPKAVKNISEIINIIPNNEKVLMLDHDDLFSNILKNNEPVENFRKYIEELNNFCRNNEIKLLRTIGVMFSDEEKRVSDYIQ